jgi:hypothetical protein
LQDFQRSQRSRKISQDLSRSWKNIELEVPSARDLARSHLSQFLARSFKGCMLSFYGPLLPISCKITDKQGHWKFLDFSQDLARTCMNIYL